MGGRLQTVPVRGRQPSVDDEWLDELVERWNDVYKKSATSVVLLHLVADRGPIGAGDLRDAYAECTGWSVTERGLYRTLRRLAADGLLDAIEVDAERTGAKRNEFTLSHLGGRFLERVGDELVILDGLVGPDAARSDSVDKP